MNTTEIRAIFDDAKLEPNLVKQLRKKSPEELATWQETWKPLSAQWILAEKEWDRRLQIENVKWLRVSVFAGLLGTVLGAFLSTLSKYF